MKRKSFGRMLPALLLLAVLLNLSACGGDVPSEYTTVDGAYQNEESTAIVVILGNHANAMAIPADAYNALEESLDNVVYGGYICAVIADGTPTKLEIIDDEKFFSEDAKNPVTLNKRIKDRKSTVVDKLKTLDASADSSEVDLLAAIREAKSVLSSNRVKDIKNKEIFIIDTGISTTGDLNFVNMDFLDGRPDVSDVIDRLSNYEGVGVLPDLTGITVTFCGTADGLAEVAAPQQMSTTDKHYIREFWSEVVTACGADHVEFENVAGWDTPNFYTEDSNTKFPYVSVVTFYHESVIDFSDLIKIDTSNPDTQPDLPAPPVVEIKLSSETVGFQPDGADYLNSESARKVLRPYAEELKKFFGYYPDEKIWIVGTTAAVQQGAAGSIELSLQRAETVRNTLIELGIPEKNLVTLGLGAKFPWAVDEHPNGTFDTVVAQANRAVWLLTAREDNDLFNELMAAHDSGSLLQEAVSRIDMLKK